MVGRLDAEEILAIDEQAAALIPGARLRFLDGVAHVPHLEGDPATLDAIAAFVDGRWVSQPSPRVTRHGRRRRASSLA